MNQPAVGIVVYSSHDYDGPVTEEYLHEGVIYYIWRSPIVSPSKFTMFILNEEAVQWLLLESSPSHLEQFLRNRNLCSFPEEKSFMSAPSVLTISPMKGSCELPSGSKETSFTSFKLWMAMWRLKVIHILRLWWIPVKGLPLRLVVWRDSLVIGRHRLFLFLLWLLPGRREESVEESVPSASECDLVTTTTTGTN